LAGAHTTSQRSGRRRRLSDEAHPEHVEPAAPDREGDVIPLDTVRDREPGGPDVREVCAEVVIARAAVRARKHVKRAQGGSYRVLVEIGRDDVEARVGVEAFEIAHQRVLYRIGGDVALQQRASERLEQVRLIEAQLRDHPVFRVKEDFAVCLPDPVPLYPCPPVGINSTRRDIELGIAVGVLHVEQAALHKGLQR